MGGQNPRRFSVTVGLVVGVKSLFFVKIPLERVLHRVTPEIGGGGTPIFQSNSSKGRDAAEVCNVNTLSSFLIIHDI